MNTLKYKALALLFAMFASFGIAQEEAEPKKPERPLYLVITTQHFNFDNENFKMDRWKEMEKEYLEKVTRKNEHIVDGGFYRHMMGPDSREVVRTAVYMDWAAIEKAGERESELVKEAWPDENERKEFMKELSSYYLDEHSDEIYYTLPFAKPISTEELSTDKIVVVQRRHLKPFMQWEEGDGEALEEFLANVVHKNEFIKGYYPNRHAWGADSSEFMEAYYLDSMEDMDKMFKRNSELSKAYYSDEAKKKDWQQRGKRMFKPKHEDYVYSMVPELRVRVPKSSGTN